MKTSRLNRVAGIFFALILTAGVAVSGEISEGKGRNYPGAQPTCIPSISGLSEYQKQRINQLEALNHASMRELQTKRRAATEKAQKTELKKQMDKQAENHRNSITSLLSADQQKQFLQFQTYGGIENNQNQQQGMGKGKGSGNGHGNGSGKGRGNGNRHQM